MTFSDTSFSTDVSFIASQALARGKQPSQNKDDGTNSDSDTGGADAMAALERQVRTPAGFVAASSGPQGGNITRADKPTMHANPDALDVELDD